MIRQPIVTICGHVDHGKTSILDKLRGTSVTAGEAGGITQKITFTLFPAENIRKGCYLIDKRNIPLKIPGFLFIDTPGHQAFTNLRKRGGSLADMAIVVIDINEGIMPQTAEVFQILKANKTPFIIALNKIDKLSGWRKQDDELKKSIESQAIRTTEDFQEKLYTIIAAIESHGFKSDLFYNIEDFTKRVALVPISARTEEGLPELLMVLCGLSQKFLSEQLNLGEKAKGVIFEIKKDRAMNHIEAILYDGILKAGDEIAIASFDKPVLVKVRAIEEICPLCTKFKPVQEARASIGMRLQITDTKNVLPGMPFQIFEGNMAQLEKEFKKDLGEIKPDSVGIIAKADSLGSLEALLTLLKQANIMVLKASIGPINKHDITDAKANQEKEPLNAVILGFNVGIDEEAKEIAKEVKILTEEVVYKLIENCQKWRQEKQKEIEREKLLGLSTICKLEILPQYVFRNSKPAVFGVKILGGKLKQGTQFIDEKGEKIGKLKGIQHEKESIREATPGMEVAISLPGTTFDRQLKETKFLYSDLSEQQFKEFKKNKDLLSSEELRVLQEIAEIKRREKITWGV